MHSNENYLKTIKVANLGLISICVIGFVYQVYLIFEQYMLGKTVVNIDVKRLESQQLPAITICIPHRFQLSKLSELSETNKILYQDYMNLLNQTIVNGTFGKYVEKKMRDII